MFQPQPVGILGAGQLAKMLGESALRMGLSPLLLAEGTEAPAVRAGLPFIEGTPSDTAALEKLLARVQFAVFENEFIPSHALSALQKHESKLRPSAEVLASLGDKLDQKRCLERLQIPSAAYLEFIPGSSLQDWLREVLETYSHGAVIKWGKQGYDGKGVCASNDLPSMTAFCESAIQAKSTLYAEAKVPFVREMAMVACRSVNGEFGFYPLVISEQRDGVCFWVYGPATELGVSRESEEIVAGYAKRLGEELDLVGCFALEIFEHENGELWVNEIAPRVHNTGHYTQDAARTSQFENHWRAALGLPLGQCAVTRPFAMINLLGPKNVHALDDMVVLPVPNRRMHLHWYGKKEIRPGRKVGHINAVCDDMSELPELLNELDAVRGAWEEQLRGMR